VDNPDHPQSCFISTAEGCFLAGDPNNHSFNAALGKYLHERLTSANTEAASEKELFLYVVPHEWTKHFVTLFPTKSPTLIPRRYYTCTQLKWNEPVPPPYTITQILQPLLVNPDNAIPEHITSWIIANWGSQEAFLKRGFGFAMVHQNHLVSWSLADCVSGNRCEIGIRTQPEYRRQGLATLTVAATVNYALQHGFNQIGWHTSTDNFGSIGVAEKVGFTRSTDYNCHLFRF
jgi:RimJ/RimL family protein N-acetyltransferase